MRVGLVSTHRSDRAHYAPLANLLRADPRFLVHPSEEVNSHSETQRPELDIAVILGDRREMLLAAIFFAEWRIPILHIHGGEHTYGALDERWRWAITEIADEHCVVNQQAANALRPSLWSHVHITGAPGLDDILPRGRVIFPHKLIVHYNPAIDRATSQREFRSILEALAMDSIEHRIVTSEQVKWIRPNGDRFSEFLGHGEELDPNNYRDELAAAHVIVGNSSAGIIEAPSLGTWAVNVGDRQAGRIRGGNVIDVPGESTTIRESLLDALQRPRYDGANPYRDDGHASERIRDVLLAMV